MLGANDVMLKDPLEVTFDDIRAVFWGAVGENTEQELTAYAQSRIPRHNGERLSGRGLTLVFFPSEFEGFDTFIGNNVDMGKNVVIGYHVNVGHGTVIGNDVHIEIDCTIGADVTIGDHVDIGKKNVIPERATIDAGLSIPNGLFRAGELKDGVAITQELVAKTLATSPSLR